VDSMNPAVALALAGQNTVSPKADTPPPPEKRSE